jgi:DNA-binding transcriptional ArsR family regulator
VRLLGVDYLRNPPDAAAPANQINPISPRNREQFLRAAVGPTNSYYLHMNASSAEYGPIAEDQVHLVVEVFRMLADPTRIQVLWALSGQESSVNDLAQRVGKPAPSVSQHLAKLRMARLVRTRRSGTTIFYSLENEHVRQLVVDAVFNAEHAGPGVPSHHRAHPDLRSLDGDFVPRKRHQR